MSDSGPTARKMVAANSKITLQCASSTKGTGCERTDVLPAVMIEGVIKPIQVYPYICLACWRAGWRASAIEKGKDITYDVYKLETPK